MPHDAGVNLAGEVGSVFGDDLDEVLDALGPHRRCRGVLVVRNPCVGGCIPRSWAALCNIFAEFSPLTAVGEVKNVRTNSRS